MSILMFVTAQERQDEHQRRYNDEPATDAENAGGKTRDQARAQQRKQRNQPNAL